MIDNHTADTTHKTRDIIVIGASAGGVEPLGDLISNIPDSFSGTIFIVQHMPAYAESYLAHILNRKSPIPVLPAEDGLVFEKGKIYCCQPDRHLILEGDKMLLSSGPKENRFRPSIDALFRSAAYEYKERVTGVVLSGSLNDGTAGMCTIKRFGGVSMIQLPDEAIFSSMPIEVGKYTEVDYSLPAAELGVLIGELSQNPIEINQQLISENIELIKKEIEIAKNKNALGLGVFESDRYTPFTCPDCNGALVQMTEEGIIRFRCHTGHGFTSDALLAGVTENMERDLWKVMRGMEEGNLVLKHLSTEFEKIGASAISKTFDEKAKILIKKSRKIHGIIKEADVMSIEKLEAS